MEKAGKHGEKVESAKEEYRVLEDHSKEAMKKAEDLRKELALVEQNNALAKAKLKESESAILNLQVYSIFEFHLYFNLG